MVKVDNENKTILIKTPLTERDKKIIEDYSFLGYAKKIVEKIRESNIPSIKKEMVDTVLSKSLKEDFEGYKKIQSIDKATGKPKFKVTKKGEKVPVTIGFRGALVQLEKNHPEEYKKLVDAAAAAKAE